MRHKTREFDPWFGKVPWRRKWQLTPVFLPGKSHGQRSLVGYMGSQEWDTTERLGIQTPKQGNGGIWMRWRWKVRTCDPEEKDPEWMHFRLAWHGAKGGWRSKERVWGIHTVFCPQTGEAKTGWIWWWIWRPERGGRDHRGTRTFRGCFLRESFM